MNKYILLIDDDEDELVIFTDALKRVGDFYKCTYAADAEQAMDILKEIQPGFIFVDYNLPRINGLEFISVARNSIRPGVTRVFLYSTKIDDEMIKMARLLGAAGCIEKPLTVAGLARELKILLDPESPRALNFFQKGNNNGM
jgi:CheY-like chemotaxis protein